jgi:hypothetical protein
MNTTEHLRLIAQQHPEETAGEHRARLEYRQKNLNRRVPTPRPVWHWILAAVVLVGLVALLAVGSRAQTTNQSVNINRIGGTLQSGSTLNVNCVIGCSGSATAIGMQVRNAGDTAWVNVGFNVANLTLPVTLQAGSAAIGSITNTGFNVNNFPATQAVTQSGTWNIGTLTSITNAVDISDRVARLLGHVTVDNASLAVTGTFFQVTQPISSTQLPAALDGSGFLKTHEQGTAAISSTQLPAALDGSGFLKTHEQGTATVAGGANIFEVSPTTAANTNTNPFFNSITDGTTKAAVIAATAALKTDLSSVAGTATSTAAAGVLKVGVVGNAGAAVDAANNAAAPANVLVNGVETIAQGSQPTAATAGNVRRSLATVEGAAFVQEGSSNRFSCFVQAVTVTTQCQAAPGAGLRAYVTSAHLANQAATVQTLDIVFGTGAACVTATTALTHKMQFGTNGTTTSPIDLHMTFQTPLVPTAANAICVRPSAATAFGATLTGFIAP